MTRRLLPTARPSLVPRPAVAALLLCLAGSALGCGAGSDGRAEETPEETSSSSPSEDPSSSGLVDAAVADLAAHLGVDPQAVEVVAVEEVTWRDGSLGCAKPGTAYTQALVEGARITLRVDGVEHEYHQGGSGTPVRCAEPTE